MKIKKIILLTFILVSLVAVSVVSAADNDTMDVISVEESTYDTINVDETEVVSAEDNQVILGDESSFGTFTDLAKKINSGESEIVLDCDYRYNSTIDTSYQGGVTINEDKTISKNR